MGLRCKTEIQLFQDEVYYLYYVITKKKACKKHRKQKSPWFRYLYREMEMSYSHSQGSLIIIGILWKMPPRSSVPYTIYWKRVVNGTGLRLWHSILGDLRSDDFRTGSGKFCRQHLQLQWLWNHVNLCQYMCSLKRFLAIKEQLLLARIWMISFN